MTKVKQKLVIVESPSKAKTINKYLGKEYLVLSSKGHIIDLPKSRLAVDVENNFKPEYRVIHGRSKDLKFLKSKAAEAEEVLLAADPDREGEAISWHLANAFKDVNPSVKRVIFNEITADVIRESIKNPGQIDENLVNAQQARRIMDRLVGYHLSPLLWKKVKSGLSAGRVQSVALRIICEREDEIDKFIPQEYWDIIVELGKDDLVFPAKIIKFKDEKIEKLLSEDKAKEILKIISSSELTVSEINEKIIKRRPLPPYTTAKMQQDAVNRLGLTAKRTMQVAQMLYEGVDLPGEGPVGLITYMRTDSTRISPAALNSVRRFILSSYGKDYLPAEAVFYSKSQNSQDAHEAIRPTSVERTPDSIKNSLDRTSYRLYKMIWERFVASQMTESVFKNIQVKVKAKDIELLISGSEMIFAGYNKVFSSFEKEDIIKGIDKLSMNDRLFVVKSELEKKYTSPPPRYTDASLVKVLEESGIGRPSTYAPTIATLLSRYYVIRQDRYLVPTPLGRKVNELLVNNFPHILDINFTVLMEKDLDEIAVNKKNWVDVVREFYTPFVMDLEKAHENIEKIDIQVDQKTDFVCEKCGKPMVKKLGRYGYFLACSGFPECKNIKPLPLGKCPKAGCDGDVVKKKGRRGRVFFGCNKYPACDFVTYSEPLEEPCPKCGKIMVKIKEQGKIYKECLNENCKYREEYNI